MQYKDFDNNLDSIFQALPKHGDLGLPNTEHMKIEVLNTNLIA